MGRRGSFRNVARVWGSDPSSACRQWLEPDKLLGSWYGSEERQGAQPEPRGSRVLLACWAESCQVPACPPGEGRHGQHDVLETVRKAQWAMFKPMLQGL